MYIPIWKRTPNKFIRYEDRPFELPKNAFGEIKSGISTYAIFMDRNGKIQEVEAYIKWTK